MEQIWNKLSSLEASYGLPAAGLQVSGYWRAAVYVGAALLLLVVLEQLNFLRKRGHLRGPRLPLPLLGGIVEMIVNPVGFWDRQRDWAMEHGASWNTIIGYFTVFCTKANLSRYVLSHNAPDEFLMYLHPNGEKILGANNIGFQTGARHKALRRSFLTLFTRKALGVYLSIQERLIHEHVQRWISEGTPGMEMRTLVRDLNVVTSQTVFVGPYLDDPKEFSRHYLNMTLGFLAVPICFPGTALWRAVQSRKKVQHILSEASRRSKENMKAGKQPACLLDFWSQRVLEEIAEAEQKGEELPHHSSNYEMATTTMDFLFASQDASTASLTQIIALMADHPDILQRVRKEQAEVNPNNDALTYELLEKMVFTRQVVKETLRYRPPAPMVIQKAMKDITLENGYTCPKGSMVIPSLTAACQEGFTNPSKFDPDRMGPERKEDVKFRENFLVFGTGPHMCVGREYATNHLVAFLSIIATTCQWTRQYTAKSGEIRYLPTIYPADCLITWKAKED